MVVNGIGFCFNLHFGGCTAFKQWPYIYAPASKPALTLALTSNINCLERVTGSYLSKSCQLIPEIDQKIAQYLFEECGSYGQKGNQPLLAVKTVVNVSQLWL